jgi:hypothetical protein
MASRRINRILAVSLGLFAVGSTASATDVTGALTFVGITPCRIVDTRNGQGFTGQWGPPALVANADRTFQITGTTTGTPTQCGIPTTALAISVNFTVTGFTGAGDIRVAPAGSTLPLASILNYSLQTIANATTVPLGPSGGGQNGITVHADATGTDFIVDVNGYYVGRPFILESGQTLTGTFGIEFAATAINQRGSSAISFPFRLATAPAAPSANFIPQGGASTTNCPGTHANPTALPGNLCVYETFGLNIATRCIAQTGTSYACGLADTYGSSVFIHAAGAGQTSSVGTWAVTAP